MLDKLLHTDAKDIAATAMRIVLGIVILPHEAFSGDGLLSRRMIRRPLT